MALRTRLSLGSDVPLLNEKNTAQLSLDDVEVKTNTYFLAHSPAREYPGLLLSYLNRVILVLCRELLVINPFQAKYKTTARAKLWDQAAENLAKTTRPAFKKSLDKRAVQERYRLLTEKFKKRMAKERIESGINPTMSELDVLVEELVEREQTEKHQRENDGKLQ